MEIWEVVGFRKVDFKDDNGKDVNGHTLYLQRLPESQHIAGMECCKMFVSARVEYTPNISDTIRIDYNRYGKISNIAVI